MILRVKNECYLQYQCDRQFKLSALQKQKHSLLKAKTMKLNRRNAISE